MNKPPTQLHTEKLGITVSWRGYRGYDGEENGAPERIRTSDLCLRRAALYPAELRVPVKTHRTLSISFSVIEALYCNHGCFCILLEPQWSIAARESVNILTAYRYSDMPFHTPE